MTSREGTEQAFARALEVAAIGGTVHDFLSDWTAADPEDYGKLTPEQAGRLVQASCAACDAATELIEQGLDPADLDPSWMRLRNYSRRIERRAI